MYRFPDRLYCDVRIEDHFSTRIAYTYDQIDEVRERRYRAGMVRIFDGQRWYYAATTDVNGMQAEIDRLAGFAQPTDGIERHAVVDRLTDVRAEAPRFEDDRVDAIPTAEKDDLLRSYFGLFTHNELKSWSPMYRDAYVRKSFVSSKGASIAWDYQLAGVAIGFNLADDGEKQFSEVVQSGGNRFSEIVGHEEEYRRRLEKSVAFLHEATPVAPGEYPMVLSPMVAGVFAHESFGHKSEADFMVGDETMRREWTIGKSVGSPILTIIDDGTELGVGYTPFDDEGTPGSKTYLIKNGELAGRLHSCTTSADLDEAPTGNARAVDFEYQPIVRMTTTYIDAGEQTKDDLVGGVEDGLLVEGLNHGSGLSTFTIAPTFAYRIREGRVADPVQVSVISGNVFQTLGRIDGVSDEVTLLSFVRGGCGKSEQAPLPVGFGGPWVRVSSLAAQ